MGGELTTRDLTCRSRVDTHETPLRVWCLTCSQTSSWLTGLAAVILGDLTAKCGRCSMKWQTASTSAVSDEQAGPHVQVQARGRGGPCGSRTEAHLRPAAGMAPVGQLPGCGSLSPPPGRGALFGVVSYSCQLDLRNQANLLFPPHCPLST